MNKKISILVALVLIIVVAVTIVFAGGISKNSKSNENKSISEKSNGITNLRNSKNKTYEIDMSEFDAENETKINLDNNTIVIDGIGAFKEDNIVTITKGGIYRISGTSNNVRIVVNADEANVKLILDNAKITSEDSSAIYVYKSKKTWIYIPDKTQNSLTDGNRYVYQNIIESEKDEEPNACIYSKSDLIISGKGKLIVNASFNNAITSKDALRIEDIDIEINATNHGINGKDNNTIIGSTILIKSSGDAIRSTNDKDENLGWIRIENSTLKLNTNEDAIDAENDIIIESGRIEIEAGDDGIHADKDVIINGGIINIKKSKEGIEGENIIINDGDISLYSTDDGINASTDIRGTEVSIEINGGKILVNADGDGIDSNGSLKMTGGEVVILGPTRADNGAIDTDTGFEISGGKLIAIGSSRMAETPLKVSSQGYIAVATNGEKGSTIILKDLSGNEIEKYEAGKEFSHIIISKETIKSGETYELYVNEEKINDVVANAVQSNGFGGFGGGRGFENNGERPNFESGERMKPKFDGLEKERPDFWSGEKMKPKFDGLEKERADFESGERIKQKLDGLEKEIPSFESGEIRKPESKNLERVIDNKEYT